MKTRELITAAYAEEKQELELFLKIAEALKVWEGKKITKRMEKTVAEVLGGKYLVNYNTDYSWYEVAFWPTGNYNKRDHVMIQYRNDGDQFSYERFLERNPSKYRGAIERQERRTINLAGGQPELIDQAIAEYCTAKERLNQAMGDSYDMPDFYAVQRENKLTEN